MMDFFCSPRNSISSSKTFLVISIILFVMAGLISYLISRKRDKLNCNTGDEKLWRIMPCELKKIIKTSSLILTSNNPITDKEFSDVLDEGMKLLRNENYRMLGDEFDV